MRITNQFRVSSLLSILFLLLAAIYGSVWTHEARSTVEQQQLINSSIQLNHQLENLNIGSLAQGDERQLQQWEIVHSQLQELLGTISEFNPESRVILGRAKADLIRMQFLFSQLKKHANSQPLLPNYISFTNRLKGQLNTSTAALSEGMAALIHLRNTQFDDFVRISTNGLYVILVMFAVIIIWIQGITVKKIVGKIVILDRKVRNFYQGSDPIESPLSKGNELDTLSSNFEKMADSISHAQQQLSQEIENVKNAEERLSFVIDSASLGYWDWQVKTGKLIVNQRWLDILGLATDEVTGNVGDWSERIHPEDQMQLEQYISEQIKEHNSYSIEYRMRHKDGHWVWIQVCGAGAEYDPLTDEPLRVCGTHQDITVRKRADADIHADKERLSVTLRSIGDGVITTDTNGKIISVNKVAETLTGWIEQEALGQDSKKVFNIINEKTGLQSVSPFQRVLESGRIIGMANHTVLVAKDGQKKSIADSGAPIRDAASKIIGVVIVFRDITNEQKMEEEILKGRKLEAVGVLAGGIAHDFNNILAAILGNIELATCRIVDSDIETKSLLEGAFKASKRATKLTRQLLTFAKGGDPVRESTSLPELIRDSADFVLPGSQVSCDYSFAENLWPVNIDAGQISQVIQNIIINSDHAMPDGGRVVIHCSNVENPAKESLLSIHKGYYVKATINDTGIGIPLEIIDKIFDPYFTTKQTGSGLGLAICHSIINKHDGYLTVDSELGKGTTFTIYLPATPSVVKDTKIKSKPKPAIKAATILIMDDEKILLDLIKSQLEVLGHKAILTNEGGQLLKKYQALQECGATPDLVIMDLTIPGGMGGKAASEKLLQIDSDAKIIVSSGYSNDPILANFSDYGFCAAIAKPFELSELSDILYRILKRQ